MKHLVSLILVTSLVITAAIGVFSRIQAQPVSDVRFTIDYESVQREYNGHTYQIIHTPDGEWNDVAAYAKSLGGYLASLTDWEEDAFAHLFMEENGFDSMYFGFSDQISEGVWLWESMEGTAYTNWNYGEPNNQGAYEHYVMYYKGSSGWNDGSGVGECAYLIEWGPYTEEAFSSSQIEWDPYVEEFPSSQIEWDPYTEELSSSQTAGNHIVIVPEYKNECSNGIHIYLENSVCGNYVVICAPGADIVSTASAND